MHELWAQQNCTLMGYLRANLLVECMIEMACTSP